MKPTVVTCTKCKKQKNVEDFRMRSVSTGIRHKQCRSCQKLAGQKHYENNKQYYIISATKWQSENRELRRAVVNEWQSRNSRAVKRCSCCTHKELLGFYRNCPRGMQVDHILRIHDGGLHCLNNLQYLTPAEHGRKSSSERWHNG